MAKHWTPVRHWARRFVETAMGDEFVTAALCAALVVVAVLGMRSYVKKLKGGCCGVSELTLERSAERSTSRLERFFPPISESVLIDALKRAYFMSTEVVPRRFRLRLLCKKTKAFY